MISFVIVRGSRAVSGAILAAALALVAFASPARGVAQAEGFRIDRFRPAPSAEDGLGVQYARTLGHLVPTVGLVVDYAHAPLLATTSGGERGEIVSHRVLAHVSGALGLGDFFELHVRAPIAFSTSEEPVVGGLRFTAPDTVALGDGALGASVALMSEGRLGLSLGLMAEALLPWGTTSSYASDTDFSARGQFLFSYALREVTFSLMVGGLGRFERQISVARSGSELEYAASILLPVIAEVDLLVEATGAVVLTEGQRHPAPLEAMAGGRFRLGAGLSLEAAVALGFSQAPGVPDVRALLGLRWMPPPPPPGDSDGDGMLDPVDSCPHQAEDEDGWDDHDGCIDPDDDGDGWIDEDDPCPRDAEDRDGYEDADGCPDPDDDGDGVRDAEDQCPRLPGADFQHGCPQLIEVAPDQITFSWPIEWIEGSSVIPVSLGGALDEMASAMSVDPRRSRWRIGVRAITVSRRDDGAALALARAEALAAALVERGIDASRLEAVMLPPTAASEVEITNQGPTAGHAAPPPRPVAPETPPPVQP